MTGRGQRSSEPQGDDVVIEVKVRLIGLSYGQARRMRDVLRAAEDPSMTVIVEELLVLAEQVSGGADVSARVPWAEWRPAVGRRQGRAIRLPREDDSDSGEGP